MEIRIEDYLDENEIKKICTNELASHVRNGAERVLSNLAYSTAHKMIDDAFDSNVADVIKSKALEVIDGLSAGSVFRKKDAWGREDSVAYKSLQKAMRENEQLICDRVRETIESHDYSSEMTDAAECFADIMIAKLCSGNK